jgi:hypothetical protein
MQMTDDFDRDFGLTVLPRTRCCIPRCRREATGLYCDRHRAQLARLDSDDDHGEDDDDDGDHLPPIAA